MAAVTWWLFVPLSRNGLHRAQDLLRPELKFTLLFAPTKKRIIMSHDELDFRFFLSELRFAVA